MDTLHTADAPNIPPEYFLCHILLHYLQKHHYGSLLAQYVYRIFWSNISIEYFCRIFLWNISVEYFRYLNKKNYVKSSCCKKIVVVNIVYFFLNVSCCLPFLYRVLILDESLLPHLRLEAGKLLIPAFYSMDICSRTTFSDDFHLSFVLFSTFAGTYFKVSVLSSLMASLLT